MGTQDCPFHGHHNSEESLRIFNNEQTITLRQKETQNRRNNSNIAINAQNGTSHSHTMTVPPLISLNSANQNMLHCDHPLPLPYKKSKTVIHAHIGYSQSRTNTAQSCSSQSGHQNTIVSEFTLRSEKSQIPSTNSDVSMNAQSGSYNTQNGPHMEKNDSDTKPYIHLVHWNAQSASQKTSAIKRTILQDDLDIVMIQDTQYRTRNYGMTNIKIHGYHTYHIPAGEDSHGLVTIIKQTIPSEKAPQIDTGEGTESLSIKIWLNNKPLTVHNTYRVDCPLDVSATLTAEPRSIIVGDFNAGDETWCRDHNTAGCLLINQLRNLDSFCLMNHPQTHNQTDCRHCSFNRLVYIPWTAE